MREDMVVAAAGLDWGWGFCSVDIVYGLDLRGVGMMDGWMDVESGRRIEE